MSAPPRGPSTRTPPTRTWTAQGYVNVATGAGTIVGPVSITKTDADGNVTDQIEATFTGTYADLLAADPATAFPQSSYVRWTTNQYDASSGLLLSTRVYNMIPTTQGDIGASGTNYDQTAYGYDLDERQNMTESAAGTITRTVSDAGGNTLSTWIGTDDADATDGDPTGGTAGVAAGNNMTEVSSSAYDADGNVTSSTAYVGGGADNRVSAFLYDWRGRQVFAVSPADAQGNVTYTYTQYNNDDQATYSESYWYVGSDIASDLGAAAVTDSRAASSDLLARTQTNYDPLGRAFEEVNYAVDPSTFTAGAAIADETWYDADGNVIKSQSAGSGTFTKTIYDGLGRPTDVYVGYGPNESAGDASSYPTPATLAADTILQQTDTDYDALGDSILVTTCQRNPSATGTGPLTSANARVSYLATWYDEIGRGTATADYGTELPVGGRPDQPPTWNSTTGAWDGSDGALVTSTAYNDRGEAFSTRDAAGRETRTFFDDAGRESETIQNYVTGTFSDSYPDQDVTTETTYTPDGQVATSTVVNPATGNQTTTYVYGSDLGAAGEGFTPLIHDNDLLRAVIYPDSTNSVTDVASGSTTGYDRVEYQYDRQGEQIEETDENGTVHDYFFDDLGRQTANQVTHFAADVDQAVERHPARLRPAGQCGRREEHERQQRGQRGLPPVQRLGPTRGRISVQRRPGGHRRRGPHAQRPIRLRRRQRGHDPADERDLSQRPRPDLRLQRRRRRRRQPGELPGRQRQHAACRLHVPRPRPDRGRVEPRARHYRQRNARPLRPGVERHGQHQRWQPGGPELRLRRFRQRDVPPRRGRGADHRRRRTSTRFINTTEWTN